MKYLLQPGNPPARWRTADTAGSERLAASLGIEPVTARILTGRGLAQPADARRFLAPSLDDLHDPFLMTGMRQAVDRLLLAIRLNERILIYGDYDVDGTTSIVILRKAIELAGGAADFHVPHRLRDGYGMRAEVMEHAAAAGVQLVISVDTGIRAAEAVARGMEAGIDVIVTDHHLPEAELPPALAVLNPQQPDCRYPEKNLCGVGVVFKLVQALLETRGWPKEKLRRVLESFLKLVAIGTVADVVPLTGENRVIVKHGLAGMHTVKNLGLRELLRVASLPEGVAPTAEQVAFRVAPRINAAGRMATANDVIELFTTADPARAKQLAELLHDLNADRRQTEAEIVRSILEECEREPVTGEQASLVFAGEGWHRGVLGIVAARLVERFYRPALVLGIENGVAQGSGRSIEAFHLLEALESMPDLFTKFGGHKHAAGLTMASQRVDEFRARLNEYSRRMLTPDDLIPVLRADTAVHLAELNAKAIDEVLSLAPFGHSNEQPVFICEGAEIASEPAVMKEKHLRLNVRQQGRTMAMKAWNAAELAPGLQPGQRVDLAFRVEEDQYSLSRGYPGWSCTLVDFRQSIAASSGTGG
ncbi:MAG: single-stranded-DNA-specific exonuclease RecJ [Bryobacteraceae bacterium]